MTPTPSQELRTLAMEATEEWSSGWAVDRLSSDENPFYRFQATGPQIGAAKQNTPFYDKCSAQLEADAAYIAAANPSTILALLDALEEAREVLVNCASILPRYALMGRTLGDDEEHHAVLEQVEDAIKSLATIDAGGKL